MPAAHIDQSANDRTRCPVSAGNATPSQAANLLTLRERPDVVAARISRKRRVLAAVLAVHGTAKHDYLAAILGVSRQRVSRCLSERERDEFSAAQCSKLGIAGVPVRVAA